MLTREDAHKLIDILFDGTNVEFHAITDAEAEAKYAEHKLPEDKRVVRTKTSGDKVYLLDDIKKTRQWITNGEVLTGLGFTMNDVTEVDDATMMKYNMGPALYRAPDAREA